MEKPKTITLAVNILWATLATGLVNSCFAYQRGMIPFSGFAVLITIITLALLGFFIFNISKGKNWARITYLVLFLIGLPFSVPELGAQFTAAPVVALLSILQTLLQLAALYLLFTKPGSRWFKKIESQPINPTV